MTPPVDDPTPGAPFLPVPGLLGGGRVFLLARSSFHACSHVVTKRYYIVDDRPRTPEEHLVLSDGSAVICSTSDEASARVASSSDGRLQVRRHSDLTKPDRRRLLSEI